MSSAWAAVIGSAVGACRLASWSGRAAWANFGGKETERAPGWGEVSERVGCALLNMQTLPGEILTLEQTFLIYPVPLWRTSK